jgi:hypothetical protein
MTASSPPAITLSAPFARGDDAAGNRMSRHVRVPGFELLRDAADRLGPEGAADREDRVPPQLAQQARFPAHHVHRLRLVQHQAHDHIAVTRDLGRGSARPAAELRQPFHRLAPHVEYAGCEPGLEKQAGDRLAERAQTDYADRRGHATIQS